MSSDTNKTLGVGIIGAGMIVGRQAAAFRSYPEQARLLAVADLDRVRAERAQKTHSIEAAHLDYRELLARDDIDVVSICTRPDSHAQIIKDAVKAGKHVLCEKPLTRTLAEADEVITLCDSYPRVKVSCLYQWRADPAVAFLRERQENGDLGRPVMADVHLRTWRPAEYYAGNEKRESWDLDGGGVLIVIAIHQIDLLISLLGDPLEVSARMDTFCASSEGEDTLVGWVRFGSGALASVRCTACDHRNDFSIEIVGEDATLRVIGGGSKNVCRWQIESNNGSRQKRLRALGRKQAPWRPDPGYEATRWMQRLYRLVGRTWLPPRAWWHAPFVGQYLQALHSSTEVPVPPREARRSLELTLALYQSALSDGAVVQLPLTPESPVYSGIDAHVTATLGESDT